jgi:hypothetical protein
MSKLLKEFNKNPTDHSVRELEWYVTKGIDIDGVNYAILSYVQMSDGLHAYVTDGEGNIMDVVVSPSDKALQEANEAIAKEVGDRIDGDLALGSRIDEEASTRLSEDTKLSNSMDEYVGELRAVDATLAQSIVINEVVLL